MSNCIPLFQEYLLRQRDEPVLLIRNGPISSDAPYAIDEQPGPETQQYTL